MVPTLFVLMEQANAGNLTEYIEPQHQPSVESLDPLDHAKMLRKKHSVQPEIDLSSRYPNQESRSTGGIGWSRDGRTRKRYLTSVEILEIFKDILRGLSHLHSHGIVHQDLKPPNLLLHYDESSTKSLPSVLISDFGIYFY
jgi:serine/threonine protein kinase